MGNWIDSSSDDWVDRSRITETHTINIWRVSGLGELTASVINHKSGNRARLFFDKEVTTADEAKAVMDQYYKDLMEKPENG